MTDSELRSASHQQPGFIWRERSTTFGLAPGWAHHGVVARADGIVISASADGRHLVHVDLRDDSFVVGAALEVSECHGMSFDEPQALESAIWVADCGYKPLPTGAAAEPPVRRRGRAVLLSQRGDLLAELDESRLPTEWRGWRPTSVVAWADDVWVADGYGHGLLHRFTRDGDYRTTVDGTESGVAFSQPHALAVDARGGSPRLLVGDRGNKRIAVLDGEGRWQGSFGAGVLTSPSGFAVTDEQLVVTELHGGVVVFDEHDRLVRTLGDPSRDREVGWPNVLMPTGEIIAPALEPGVFRSPHGVAVKPDGSIVVTEWLLGGRLIDLTPHVLRVPVGD